MRSIRRLLLTGGSLLAALLLAGASAPHGLAQSSRSLSLAIYPGSCFTLDGDPLYTLASAERPRGSKVRALPALSETIVDVPLDQLQGRSHAIVVTRSGKLSGLLACGEIHTSALPDGSIAVGLREQVGSTYAGLAILTPNGGQTFVRAFVAAGLGEGVAMESTSADALDDRIQVNVYDDEIDADRTEFQVGQRIEFVVTNMGDKPHEVMIEPLGGNEEPLEGDDGQAETEDLAPDETGSFIFTFEEPGTYQFADHIGDNRLVLEITVE